MQQNCVQILRDMLKNEFNFPTDTAEMETDKEKWGVWNGYELAFPSVYETLIVMLSMFSGEMWAVLARSGNGGIWEV